MGGEMPMKSQRGSNGKLGIEEFSVVGWTRW